MLCGPVSGRWCTFFCLVFFCRSYNGLQYDDDLSPNIYAIRPNGVRVTVSGHPELSVISFHANINEPISKWKQGDINLDLQFNGRDWVSEDPKILLEDGDVIYYWMFIKDVGNGEFFEGRSFIPRTSANKPSRGTSIAVRQNIPTKYAIDPTTQFSQESLSGTLLGTLIDSITPHRQNEPLQTPSPTISQPFLNVPFLQTPAQNTGVNTNQPQITFTISPSQPSFTNPAPATFTVTPQQTSLNNPNPQNQFNGNSPLPVVIPVQTQSVQPSGPVYIPQIVGLGTNPTLSNINTPVPASEPVPTYPNQQYPSGYPSCEKSLTTVNGRQACKDQVILHETFNYYNLTSWTYDMEFPSLPDSEFCVFTGLKDNSRTAGSLKIWPTLTDNKYGDGFILSGRLDLPDCTAADADHCSQEGQYAYILPPTMSARYSTRGKWSFKYGRVDIVAKLARGDWLYPEIWLVPSQRYGNELQSRLEIATVRGNSRLRNNHGEEIGARLLEVAASVPSASKRSLVRKEFKLKEPKDRLWTDSFHTYSLLWTKDAIAFSVDGIEIGVLGTNDDMVSASMFNEEMHLVIGLGVGGVRVFPDTVDKPWTNTEPKAMYKFWNAKDKWYRTWIMDEATLTVQEVKITSL